MNDTAGQLFVKTFTLQAKNIWTMSAMIACHHQFNTCSLQKTESRCLLSSQDLCSTNVLSTFSSTA